jgi:trafficking protein particle complex subunit 8
VPHIAVHASDDTNALARDKGFEDFKELLRPYGETVTGKINIRDSHGLGQTYDDFGIRITGMWDLLDDGIMTSSNGPSLRPGGGLTATGKIPTGGGNLDDLEKLMAYHVDRAEETKGVMITGDDSLGQSMYNLFLRRMLSRMPVSPHETFTHPVACIIAISSRNANPIEALRKLYDSGNQVPIPLYVSRDYLRYYVLVHDDDRDDFEV